MRPIILASQSPRRRILLRQIGLRFRVVPSHVPERIRHGETPRANARRIAVAKAREVASRTTNALVIGADTIVVLDGHILGKPSSPADARRMLRKLSGRQHVVYTGFALVDARTGYCRSGVEATRVRFRRLTREEIDAYVKSGSPMDKAGAYGIQDDFGAVFVEKVNGCFYTVVGFPLSRFYSEWERFLDELNTHSAGNGRWNGRSGS
jgi:septum formation protein